MGDHIFLKVTPTKGMMSFGVRGKLSPRYMDPFEILERIWVVAYHLALLSSLARVHNVFYISMLWKYVTNPNHVVEFKPLQLREDLSYEERPVRIIDRKDQVLRRCTICYVKVQWSNHTKWKAIWKLEEEMQTKYPQLFLDSGASNFEEKIFVKEGGECENRSLGPN